MNLFLAQTSAPNALGPVVGLLVSAIGLVSLVCWILEIVAAFKKEKSPLMGILSIVLCSLGGFVIGWIFAKKWGLQKVMLIWTAAVVIGVVLNAVFGVAIFSGFRGMPLEAP